MEVRKEDQEVGAILVGRVWVGHSLFANDGRVDSELFFKGDLPN